MSRILEVNPSSEDAVVSRVLLLVHKSIDEQFPNLQNSSRQFTKTVFSEDGENTAQHAIPVDPEGDQAGASLPPPPPTDKRGKAKNAQTEPAVTPSKPAVSQTQPRRIVGDDEEALSNSTRLGTEMESLKPDSPLNDWSIRIILALLIAGLVLLTYAVLI